MLNRMPCYPLKPDDQWGWICAERRELFFSERDRAYETAETVFEYKYTDQVDWLKADHYIEIDLFFDNMGATGFDGMTDV